MSAAAAVAQQLLLPHLDHAGAPRRARERRDCCGGCTATSPRRPIAARPISPSCCWCPGVGARTVRALAMVAEVVHGAPCRFADPARFSFAHGGKDRHPFPVPLKVYDETIRGAEVRRPKGEARPRGRTRRVEAARRAGAQARASRLGSFRRGGGGGGFAFLSEGRRLRGGGPKGGSFLPRAALERGAGKGL